MKFALDRIALEDVGPEPRRLAAAILSQIAYARGRVPIREIAFALGIAEIREERLANLEATILMTEERDCGSILINANSSRQRKRFSIGHELGHFLNPYHREVSATLSCSSKDMAMRSPGVSDQHRKQEAEANRFAIELLAPRIRCESFMGAKPAIQEILALGREFDISREAAARRYAELHGDAVAVAFGKDRRFQYSARSPSFPSMSLRNGDPLFLSALGDGNRITEMEEAELTNWADGAKGSLQVQTLFQADDRTLSLLRFLADTDDDEPEVEDSFDRFSRLSNRN